MLVAYKNILLVKKYNRTKSVKIGDGILLVWHRANNAWRNAVENGKEIERVQSAWGIAK